MKKIVLSSDNKHKVKEIQEILKENVEIITKSEIGLGNLEVEENYNTLEENAYIKAKAIKDATVYGVIADDTGLFVEALNGEPGVHSARYAKDHSDSTNRKLLLKKLENEKNRKAYFKTILVYIDENNNRYDFEGIIKGTITEKELGKTDFGYDAIFKPEGYEKTFGEMTDVEKNQISHRKNAVIKLKKHLEEQR